MHGESDYDLDALARAGGTLTFRTVKKWQRPSHAPVAERTCEAAQAFDCAHGLACFAFPTGILGTLHSPSQFQENIKGYDAPVQDVTVRCRGLSPSRVWGPKLPPRPTACGSAQPQSGAHLTHCGASSRV